MDTNNSYLSSKDHSDEGYINMEVSSYRSSFSCLSTCSSPQSRDFEFQMASITNNVKDSTISPADELFYRGRLLPLHQKLLQTTKESFEEEEEETFSINFLITPIASCNIPPASESCRMSYEMNSHEHSFEWSTEITNSYIDNHNPKKDMWSKKLKFIKQSLINQKIKASTEYFKSLFSKFACTRYAGRPTLGSIIRNIDMEGVLEDNAKNHRSLSEEINWHSPTKCLSSSSSNSSLGGSSSSSFSFNSSGKYDLRSSSVTSVVEGSIESAIAHCKKSQELTFARNKLNVVGVDPNQEGPGLFRF